MSNETTDGGFAVLGEDVPTPAETLAGQLRAAQQIQTPANTLKSLKLDDAMFIAKVADRRDLEWAACEPLFCDPCPDVIGQMLVSDEIFDAIEKLEQPALVELSAIVELGSPHTQSGRCTWRGLLLNAESEAIGEATRRLALQMSLGHSIRAGLAALREVNP